MIQGLPEVRKSVNNGKNVRIDCENSLRSGYHIQLPVNYFDDLIECSNLEGMSGVTRIFGYGSLLNEASLRKTVPDAKNLYPAKVYGFRRVFNIASHYRFCVANNAPVCVLNVETADSGFELNGICFELESTSFEPLMSREKIYQMREVTVHRYYDDEPRQSAILFQANNHDLFGYLKNSEAQRHYLNLCIRGCEVYGADFVKDFKSSTSFWGIDSENELERIWLGNY